MHVQLRGSQPQPQAAVSLGDHGSLAQVTLETEDTHTVLGCKNDGCCLWFLSSALNPLYQAELGGEKGSGGTEAPKLIKTPHWGDPSRRHQKGKQLVIPRSLGGNRVRDSSPPVNKTLDKRVPASSALSPAMLAVSFLPAPGCFLLLPGPESDLDPPVSLANWYSSCNSQPESLLPLLQWASPLLPTRARGAAPPTPHCTLHTDPTARTFCE